VSNNTCRRADEKVEKVSRGTCTRSDQEAPQSRRVVATITRSTSPLPLPQPQLPDQLASALFATRPYKRMKFTRQPSGDSLVAPATSSPSGKQVDAGLLQRLENITLEDNKGPVIVFSEHEEDEEGNRKVEKSAGDSPRHQLAVPAPDVHTEPKRPPIS